MADEDKQDDKHEDKHEDDTSSKTRDSGSERRTEERREETRQQTSESRTEAPEPTEDCPDCDLPVKASKLGSHRWKAHQVDRRQPADKGKRKTPPARRRPPGDSSNDGKEGEDKEKEPSGTSRWADVRKSW